VNTRLLIASCLCAAIGVVVRFDSADYRQFLSWVKDAWTLSGLTRKDLCDAMQLDKSEVSRIVSCQQPLHAHRLAMLGARYPVFFQNLALVLVREHGLSREAEAGAALVGSVRRAS
jgi:hypothetical protein